MTAQLVDPLPDSDPVLLTRVRAGDADAYALLFERHRASATAFAGGLAGHHQADDLVAEAFTKVLDALQRGLGPTVSFRSYLLTTIRSIWNNTIRRDRRQDLVDDFETLPVSEGLRFTDDPEQRFDNQAVANAYRTLPERWQAVLWYTAVEGLPHSEVAVLLGIKANAVAAVSFRAREGLRQAYLSAHLHKAADTACQDWAPLLPAYARDHLDRRKQPGMAAHLEGCISCTLALADLDEVNNRLGALLLPIVLGPGLVGLEKLWAGITVGTPAGPTAGVVATGKLGGALLAGKTGFAVTVVTTIVGVVVALPILLHVLSSGDDRHGRPDATTRAVDSTAALSDPTAEVTGPGRGSGSARARDTADASATEPSPPTTARAEPPAKTFFPPTGSPTHASVDPVDPVDPQPSASTLSPDLGIGVPTFGQVSVLGQSLTTMTFPLTNVRPGSAVTVVVTNLVGFPLTWGNAGWRCPGAVGGLPGDVIRTETVITCTRTGGEQASGVLTLALLTSGASGAVATVTQAPGILDPVAANDTVTVAISQ